MEENYCLNLKCRYAFREDEMYRLRCKYVENVQEKMEYCIFSTFVDENERCPLLVSKNWKCPVCGYAAKIKTFAKQINFYGEYHRNYVYCTNCMVMFLRVPEKANNAQ